MRERGRSERQGCAWDGEKIFWVLLLLEKGPFGGNSREKDGSRVSNGDRKQDKSSADQLDAHTLCFPHPHFLPLDSPLFDCSYGCRDGACVNSASVSPCSSRSSRLLHPTEQSGAHAFITLLASHAIHTKHFSVSSDYYPLVSQCHAQLLNMLIVRYHGQHIHYT
jgi:hypothetical protein